jgi:hypothetical protein
MRGVAIRIPAIWRILLLSAALAVCGTAVADDTPTTPPALLGTVAYDADLAYNAEPTARTNATTVTLHLIGAEGWYDAVHLAENVAFSSNTQSHWRPPLGNYDGGTTITFILSPGDALKTIWAVLDGGGETFSTPPTSATLTLDTTQPDVTTRTLQTQPNLRLHVSMVFSEPVHEFTAGDIWLGGVALAVENFAGGGEGTEGTEYAFDVVASGEGELTIGFYTEDVFDLAGNPVIEQASPLAEYYPFTPLETPGATESAALIGGLFSPETGLPFGMEEFGAGGGSMLLGSLPEVWVDFLWASIDPDGSQSDPFHTLDDGLAAVADGGTVTIKAGSTAETFTGANKIGQNVRLEAWNGAARLGDPNAPLIQPPAITTQPQNKTVNWGGQATFTVAATGTAPLAYQWMKNGEPVSDNARISGANTNALTILNLRLTDQGGYRCQAINSAGSVLSNSAQLTVSFTPVFNGSRVRIVSDPFKYYAGEPPNYTEPPGYGDLDYIFNRGAVYDNALWRGVNPTPPSVSIPPSANDYNMEKSVAGHGDIWPLTWVETVDSRPILYMANGDGYGLSYLPLGYTTFSYPDPLTIVNPGPDRFLVADVVPAPRLAVNVFDGVPGDFAQLSNTSGNYENGHGETRARFIWIDPTLPEGSAYKNVDKFIDFDVEDMHADDEPTKRLSVYWNDSEVKPTGMLYINGKLYMACHRHDDNFAVNPAYDAHVFSSEETTVEGVDYELGEFWEPQADDDPEDDMERLGTGVLRRIDFRSPTWTDYRFTTPVFIQFGEAYADFDDAFPSGDVPTAEQGEVYVYALSTHHSWWNRDELYLGRVKVGDGAGWTTDDIRDGTKWEYWSGMEYTDFGGQKRLWPRWASDVDLANAVLHSDGEIGQPSIIYHQPSDKYYMTTWTNSDRETLDGRIEPEDDNPYGGRHDNRWFLWEADRPWGPWKKIFTNDFHGRQNDHPDVIMQLNAEGEPDRFGAYGFMGYAIQIVPTWFEDASEGGWKIWLLQSGFWQTVGAYTGPCWLWDGQYTTEFIQLHIKPEPMSGDNVVPIMENYQQNDHKMPGALLQKRIGYLFEAQRDFHATHIGRYYDTGNALNHALKLLEVDVNGGQASPVGLLDVSLSVGMNSTTGLMDRHGFQYGSTGVPVLLEKGKKYLVLSDESNADYYYGDPDAETPDNPDIPEIKAGNSITVMNYAVETGTGTNVWDLGTVTNGAHPGNSMGLVNLLIADESATFAEAGNLGLTGQESIYAGMNFTADQPVIVTHLGRYKYLASFPNQLKHEIKILRTTTQREHEPSWAQVAWGIVDMANAPESDGFVYAELETPVRLEAGETYLLVSREYNTTEAGGSEVYFHGNSNVTWPMLSYPQDVGIQVIGAGYFSVDTRIWNQITGQDAIDPNFESMEDRCFGPLSFKFK